MCTVFVNCQFRGAVTAAVLGRNKANLQCVPQEFLASCFVKGS